MRYIVLVKKQSDDDWSIFWQGYSAQDADYQLRIASRGDTLAEIVTVSE